MAIIEREPRGPAEALLQGAADTIESLAPDHDRILTPAECERIAVEIAGRGLWEGVELTPTESHTRAYALLYEDERMEMWLLGRPITPRAFTITASPTSASASPRGRSSSSSCASRGRRARRGSRQAPPARPVATTSTAWRWKSGSPALSVHVYSPPLTVVGQYRYDDGVLRRETQAGRDELTKD